MKRRVLSILFLLLAFFGYAQNSDDERIALQFFQIREYEKAEILLKKEYEKNPQKFFEYLYKTYIHLKKYDDAISITKNALKGNQSKNIDYRFKLGYAYFKKNDSVNSKKEWQSTNELITENEYQVLSLVNQYNEIRQWNFSVDAILKYQSIIKNKEALNSYLMDIYVHQGKYAEAIDIIMSMLEKSDQNYIAAISNFPFLIGNQDALRTMEKKVYAKLSKEPNSDKWNEIAMWLAVSVKDYEYAMTLAKSFEKRKNGNGSQVFQIAEVSANEGDFDVALNGYDYLIASSNSTYAKLGFERKLKTSVEKLKLEKITDTSSVFKVNREFLNYFSKYNFDYTTADVQLLFAEFNVKFLHRLDNATAILEKLISLPQLSKFHLSRGKLDLADLKLAANEIWEASLLYGQVDKEEKDSPLGEEARFKNAKIFYYNGDYELAEDLLSILKSSTTELIANDALYLAVFIQDNLDGGKMEGAMKKISSAELLFYQNRNEEAIKLLSNIKAEFPQSNLIDDILLIEANQSYRLEDYKDASEKYKEIFEKYPSSIIADRALYEWAKIEEEKNKNSASAMDAYLKLLTKHKDSVYTTDARKRLRNLRGEKLEEDL